jgi:excisionase family DNA binding protein
MLSSPALAALDAHIEHAVERQLRHRLPAALERTRLSPWMATATAASYLGISENALRLRVREGLVPAHRDGAGRLRFHRVELDQTMNAEPRRRRR